MNLYLATTVLVVGLGLAACGSSKNSVADQVEMEEGGVDVTESVVSALHGKFRNSHLNETLDFQADGTFRAMRLRHVGAERDSEVPYGTVCNYVESGQVRIFKRSDDSRLHRATRAAHLMKTVLKKIELTDLLYETTSNSACVRFAQRENYRYSGEGSHERNYYMTVIDPDSFSIDVRGDSDGELFIRVQ